ncbi:alpha/beta hydrolase family protein [Winogradskyella sp. A2]|uniref:alpha/beta hydrolase family protein n=1 Tax=Winogradskyella sp. A2 TaxID=3366944 RepID=UPI00398C601D
MNISKNLVLERHGKKPILIDVFKSDIYGNQPIIIFCHGYKGFKDWGAWDLMAKSFAKSRYCFIKFNFSHNGGTITNPIDFPDLEAFGNNNYSKELDDLNDVIDWVETRFKDHQNIDIDQIILIGHSRGGGISIIKASEDLRIKKLITLASVCDFSKRTATIGDLDEWKKSGVKYVLNGRTKQQMPHYYQFYEDFKANEERLNIESAIKKLTIPHLIIHGDNDTSVSIEEGRNLNKWNPNCKLKVIKGADHVFNAKHPWEKDELSAELSSAINSIKEFTNKKAQ